MEKGRIRRRPSTICLMPNRATSTPPSLSPSLSLSSQSTLFHIYLPLSFSSSLSTISLSLFLSSPLSLYLLLPSLPPYLFFSLSLSLALSLSPPCLSPSPSIFVVHKYVTQTLGKWINTFFWFRYNSRTPTQKMKYGKCIFHNIETLFQNKFGFCSLDLLWAFYDINKSV